MSVRSLTATISMSAPAARAVRLDVYPDGGMARLRLHGGLTTAGREDLVLRWFNRLPATQALAVSGAQDVVAARPLSEVPETLVVP